MGSQTSAWGRVSAPISRVTGIRVCLRSRGRQSISANAAYKTPVFGFISHRWGMKLPANGILLPHSPPAALLFPGPDARSLLSLVTVFLTLSSRGAPSSGYCLATAPLCISSGMPEVCVLQAGTWEWAATCLDRGVWVLVVLEISIHLYLGHRVMRAQSSFQDWRLHLTLGITVSAAILSS